METLIGKKVLHGSPYYENEETIAKVCIDPEWPDHITIDFESQFFTRISPAELEELKQDGEIHYKNRHHNSLEVMILK